MSPENQTPGAGAIEAWCAQAVAGEQSALEKLLWAHHARLLGFARRKIGVDWQGKIDPEDILQEAYIDIFSTIGDFSYRGEDSFYRWATRIVDHRFIDHARRWRRRKRDVSREVRAAGSAGSPHQSLLERCLRDTGTPSVTLRQEDALSALMACLARLPDDYRLVVQRLYLQQEPLSAVAAELNRSEDAVRRLAGRALERLARCLGRASRYLSTHG
jgi:RNA polymerase sigma-70 factor (ECF subfamily)